jgi:hypothetical protein
MSERAGIHLVEIRQRRIELIEHIELVFPVRVTGAKGNVLAHG